ncbi:FYVE finger containing protein [Phaffia rhodozyma]|uniref:FYVE finger containing protein n=1 Tax=Phaffia rhodozyma TaxID=264483 RepID=A0A0F7SFR2_PHARH|nr:FYVE finger containing protein [Phaffia rhodozyma]
MTLLTSKPHHLSPQEPSDPNRLPSTHEEARAGPRGVRPEPGSKEHLRRARLSQVDLSRASRSGSPSPSITSSTPPLVQNSSSLETTTSRSSSSSVRTPSPAYSVAPSLSNPAVTGFTPSVQDSQTESTPSSPSAPIKLLIEERQAALPKDLWKADADAEVCDRPGCGTRFGFWKERKHHCRKCGLVFCQACSAVTHPLLFPSSALLAPSTVSTPLSQSPPSLLASNISVSVSTPSVNSLSTPTLTPSTHILPSRVCVDCKTSLSSPVPERRPVSRRSSFHSFSRTLRNPNDRSDSDDDSSDDDDDLYDHDRVPTGASATSSRASSPPGSHTLNRSASTSRKHTDLSLSLSSLPPATAAVTSAIASTGPSPFRSPMHSPSIPREPWMDGPLAEFPLAYPRADKAFDPRVHSLAKVDTLGRKRSLNRKSYFPPAGLAGAAEPEVPSHKTSL